MSWTGTVRCGYCGDEGHNRRKCPTMQERAEQNPDGFSAREIARRKANQNPRACGYCRQFGHNKKTCGHRKLHIQHLTRLDTEYREEIITLMKEKSVGPGAFLIFPNAPYHSMMITHIHWEHISILSSKGIYRVAAWKAVVGKPFGRKTNISRTMEIEGVLSKCSVRSSKRDGALREFYIEGLSPKLAEKYFKNLQVKPNLSLYEEYVDSNGASTTRWNLTGSFGVDQEELVIEEPTY